MSEAQKSRHQIEQERIITEIQQNIGDVLDRYMEPMIRPTSNENIRLSIATIMEAQIQLIAPNSEYRIDVFPDANDSSLMNVDIMIRNPFSINYNVISATTKRVEIDGVVWTKFSLQA